MSTSTSPQGLPPLQSGDGQQSPLCSVDSTSPHDVFADSIAMITGETLLAQSLLKSLQPHVAGPIHHFLPDEEAKLLELMNSNSSFQWPQLTIIDCDATGQTPFTIAKSIRENKISAELVFFAGQTSDLLKSQIKSCKVTGAILKSDSLPALLECLQSVTQNKRWISPSIEPHDSDAKDDPKSTSSIDSLTTRQLEVLCYIAQGYTVKEIAKLMFLSEKSVDSHKYRIMNRLGIHDRVKLALFAVRENLIKP